MKALDEIETIVAEIERLDGALGGIVRQVEDREAGDIVHRIICGRQQARNGQRK